MGGAASAREICWRWGSQHTPLALGISTRALNTHWVEKGTDNEFTRCISVETKHAKMAARDALFRLVIHALVFFNG